MTPATVTVMAAQTLERPDWHDCLNDAEGTWQLDDGRRCVPIQALNGITGWRAECNHNRAYFPEPDWRCCVDDGTGQCVPGSEKPDSGPEETDPEDGAGPDVWIKGVSPSRELELCEGDYIHAVGIRRSNSEGELRGSVYLVDPDFESTMLQVSRKEGTFRFAEGENSVVTYALDEQRIGRCPQCGEKRDVFLGIDDRLYSGDGNLVAGRRIGGEVAFPVRKATDELCRPEE